MALLNALLPEHRQNLYISEYTFREKGCHDLLGETIVIIFAELTRFCKSEDECVTEQDRLLYLLKNSRHLKLLPKWSDEEHCRRILDAFRIQNFDEQKRNQYNNDMYDEMKRQGQLKAAREEGREEHAIETAQTMLTKGLDVELVAECTGLTLDEVQALQQQ